MILPNYHFEGIEVIVTGIIFWVIQFRRRIPTKKLRKVLHILSLLHSQKTVGKRSFEEQMLTPNLGPDGGGHT